MKPALAIIGLTLLLLALIACGREPTPTATVTPTEPTPAVTPSPYTSPHTHACSGTRTYHCPIAHACANCRAYACFYSCIHTCANPGIHA